MAEKRISYLGFRLSDTEKQTLEARAAQRGCSVSELVRELVSADVSHEPAPSSAPTRSATPTPRLPELTSHHIDDLGADSLRGADQAMVR